MIHSLDTLRWLDQHPAVYFWVVGGLIVTAVGSTIAPLLRGQPQNELRHDWVWSLWLPAILAAGRWPSILYPRELNPDEGQMLAGAHTLTADPVFWRSVNGATAGPLDFFALWPAGWLFGWNSHLPARITALLLLTIGLIAAHQCMALVLGRQSARLAMLGVATWESLTNGRDFLHYSTELLPLVLLSIAAYAAVRRWLHAEGPIWSGCGGLMLGAVPFAKVQAAPLAAIMGLIWLAAELRSHGLHAVRHRAYLVTGAIITAGLFISQVVLAGEWDSFVVSYFAYNTNYVANHPASLAQTLVGMYENSRWQDSLLHLWLPGCLVWIALMFVKRPGPAPDRSLRVFTWLSVIAGLIALSSILAPRRSSPHYWLLAVLPVCFLLGSAIAGKLAGSRQSAPIKKYWLVALCGVALPGIMLGHRMTTPNVFLGTLSPLIENPHTKLSAQVLRHAHPDETLAIWGWTNYVYVETGLRQATRDAQIAILFDTGKLQGYFRQRYLHDIKYTKPALFLDAVGPASSWFKSADYAHERQHPELAAFIREHYTLVETLREGRIYRRNDLLNPGGL